MRIICTHENDGRICARCGNAAGETIATLREQLTNAEALVERYEREAVPTHADANARMRAALGSDYSRLWGPTLEALGRQMDRVLHERDEAQRALAEARSAAVRESRDEQGRKHTDLWSTVAAQAERALADERERRERVEAAIRDFFDKPIRHVYPNGNRTGTTDYGPIEHENPVEPNERAWNERLAILRAALSAPAADRPATELRCEHGVPVVGGLCARCLEAPDPRDARIAALEAELRDLRAAISDDIDPTDARVSREWLRQYRAAVLEEAARVCERVRDGYKFGYAAGRDPADDCAAAIRARKGGDCGE